MKKRFRARRPGSGKYEIGYGRPPSHSRFKPGQSGNPKGRRRGSVNVESVFHKILNEKVSVREGTRVSRIPKLEAMIRNLTVLALRGDPKAFATVLKLYGDFPQVEDDKDTRCITVRFVKPNPAPDQGETNKHRCLYPAV
jgi:hypothetical protein